MDLLVLQHVGLEAIHCQTGFNVGGFFFPCV